MTSEDFNQFLEERRSLYKTFTPVFCNCLREYINFNADGFNHLRFHIDGRPRPEQEQLYKMGLLKLAIPTIKIAKNAEYERRLAPIGRKRSNGKKIMKEVDYWGLVGVVGCRSAKIKVVLRRIGNGQIHFWSIMKIGEELNN